MIDILNEELWKDQFNETDDEYRALGFKNEEDQRTLAANDKSIMNPEVINIADKLSRFQDYWNPRIVGELNGQHVRLVKLKGEFVWHQHDHEDEMFMVVEGQLRIELRDKTLILNKGDFAIIPARTEHKPVAEEEVHVMLFEPASTLNTGTNIDCQLTRKALEKV